MENRRILWPVYLFICRISSSRKCDGASILHKAPKHLIISHTMTGEKEPPKVQRLPIIHNIWSRIVQRRCRHPLFHGNQHMQKGFVVITFNHHSFTWWLPPSIFLPLCYIQCTCLYELKKHSFGRNSPFISRTWRKKHYLSIFPFVLLIFLHMQTCFK